MENEIVKGSLEDEIFKGSQVKVFVRLERIGSLSMDDYDFTIECYTEMSSRVVGKVYYIRITQGGNPIIDYYPCRRLSDGVEGFWDCVSQAFIEPIS